MTMSTAIKRLLRFILLVELLSNEVFCRKYNLEEDGFKLYGEDIGSILEKLRKTSVYADMLASENEVLFQQHSDLQMVLFEYMETEVSDMLNAENITAVKESGSGRSCNKKGRPASRYSVVRKPLRFHHKMTRLRTTEDERNDIAELEKYYYSKMDVPAAHYNQMIAKGFNIVKKGIRLFINTIGDGDMSGEDFSKMMTKFQVDPTVKGPAHEGDELHSTPALYRYRKRML